ncbi:hypothetical protein [Pseudoalteromonas sp. S1612]|uniref:hypothetical protein n=1 Tax=Pseudoalteromonas sp. S1612 TaxID=579507 RepID=UPI00110BF2F2|nr:hypothetical protein [Pseudoalteromonas sp. S1612]TMP58604.1 hypothetical protein CWB78_00120 [Pseudoalteromonas sp. S1612]
MEVDSIENLRSTRDLLKASVKAIKVREFEGRTFGPESEYDARGVVAGVDSIVTDIGGLLRAPKRFLQCSNHPERVALNKQLSNLNHYLTDEDLASACNHIEALKPILRGYAIRYTDERFDEFIERTNELQKEIQSLTELLSESKEAHKEILEITSTAQSLKNEIESQNETLTERQTTLEELIVESEETRNTIIDNFETDKANSSEIEELLTEVRSHSELIDSFSQKIAARENQIENQSSKSKEFEATLVNYTSQQKDYLTEAKNLIKTAKQALEYKTAEGLSAAFIAQHTAAKNPWVMGAWVFGAMLFLFSSAALGVWLTVDHDISTSLIIGRISLLPILIGGSIFCASQYVKQKKIAEDYAYKTVLTKSLVGFSEQLSSDEKKGEEHTIYIKTVLAQLLVDPQRKQNHCEARKRQEAKEVDIKSALDSLKELPSIVEKLSKAAGGK